MIIIAIDPGVKTGMAVFDILEKKWKMIATGKIHNAIDFISKIDSKTIHNVIVEDARQVRFCTDPNKKQGAGSIKRDCSIWEDFLLENEINFTMQRPNKSITKTSLPFFQKITGLKTKHSVHARDAVMILVAKGYGALR